MQLFSVLKIEKNCKLGTICSNSETPKDFWKKPLLPEVYITLEKYIFWLVRKFEHLTEFKTKHFMISRAFLKRCPDYISWNLENNYMIDSKSLIWLDH